MKFSQLPINTIEKVQINAGIIVDEFDPTTGVIGTVLAATGGGSEFDPHPTITDWGEGIDNMPAGTWQMAQIDHFEPHLTSTFMTMQPSLARMIQAGATMESGHIIPSHVLDAANFDDIWLLGDYSAVNTDGGTGSTQKAGFIALHLKHAMNVLGFRWKTNDKNKGEFAVDFRAFYDLEDLDDVPFELYVVMGTSGS